MSSKIDRRCSIIVRGQHGPSSAVAYGAPPGHPVLTTQTLLGPEKTPSAERFPRIYPLVN